MKRGILTATLLLISFVGAQVTLYDPPAAGTLTRQSAHVIPTNKTGMSRTTLNLAMGEIITSGSWRAIQLPVDIGTTATVSLTLHSMNLPENCKIYLRYPEPEKYVGPFYLPSKTSEQIHTIGHIHSARFIVELNVPSNSGDNFDLWISSIRTVSREKPMNIRPPESVVPFHKITDRTPPVILVTGYWPPTNEMVRQFSQNPELNPEGWQGDDWEGRGYDVVSYFPQFANPDCSDCGQGYGDLEVDYQDTSNDFWPISGDHLPIAIITFSRGYMDNSWEVEYNYYNRTNWIGDYSTPVMPTPNPPDQGEDAYFHRYSNLPMENVTEAVNGLGMGLNAYIDWSGDPGHFVSEFMGYHGVWYRDLNEYGENMCITAGHVHVGGLVATETARAAAEETIRQVMNYLDLFAYTPGDINQDDSINIQDLVLAVNVILGTAELSQAQFYAADVNTDSIINIQDIIIILNMILNGSYG